jgi:NDP-sugar pyrophosphorylase family protein
VIPAAGAATRLQPIDGSKELLEVGGRPVFDYVVERMQAGGADEIRIVTRPDKTDVSAHAAQLGLSVLEAEPPTAAASVATALDGLADGDTVLIGFPDSIWEPVDGYALLVREPADLVLGVFSSPEPERSDVVELEGAEVRAVHVKVAEPPGNLVWGAAAVRRGALDSLEASVELGHHFDRLARNGRARSVVFPGEFLDIGTREALARARSLLGR